MTSVQAQALAAAIKESYRRLQFSEGPLRTIRETDALIDQMVALVRVEHNPYNGTSREETMVSRLRS